MRNPLKLIVKRIRRLYPQIKRDLLHVKDADYLRMRLDKFEVEVKWDYKTSFEVCTYQINHDSATSLFSPNVKPTTIKPERYNSHEAVYHRVALHLLDRNNKSVSTEIESIVCVAPITPLIKDIPEKVIHSKTPCGVLAIATANIIAEESGFPWAAKGVKDYFIKQLKTYIMNVRKKAVADMNSLIKGMYNVPHGEWECDVHQKTAEKQTLRAFGEYLLSVADDPNLT